MSHLAEGLRTVNLWLWSGPLLLLLFATGLYLTYLLRGFQFRFLAAALKEAFSLRGASSAKGSQGDISHFQALMTSLAGAIGTGSVVGVATAIAIGGVGSLFWMWLAAFIGMATKYAESLLAVHYREVNERGEMTGGPMHYMAKGMGYPSLALFFAGVGALAAITTGNLIQVNAIIDGAKEVLGAPPALSAVVIFLFAATVMIGGVKTIGQAASFLVPLMALFYVGSGLIILLLYWRHIPEAFGLIFTSAFTGQAATGAFAGSTMIAALQMGVARSVLTSEAGLGISSIAAAAAITDKPARQAMVTMTGALFSTLLVCTMTALVLSVTGVVGLADEEGQLLNGVALTLRAFDRGLAGGHLVVTVGLVLFAFTTLLAWGYYGEKCWEYLFGAKSILVWRLCYASAILPGAFLDLQLVWQMADLANALMVLPNLIALLALSSVIKEETRSFVESEGARDRSAIANSLL